MGSIIGDGHDSKLVRCDRVCGVRGGLVIERGGWPCDAKTPGGRIALSLACDAFFGVIMEGLC